MSVRFLSPFSLISRGVPAPLGSLGVGFHVVSDDELARDPSAVPPPIDYAPLQAATRQMSAWLLGVARSHTTDPLDKASIERVQRAVSATLDGAAPGARGNVTEEDILVVMGILITAFEIDVGMVDLGALFGALYDSADPIVDHLAHVIGAAMAERIQRQARGVGKPARSAPVTRRIPVPVLVRRRPRVAHSADDLAGDDLFVLR